MGAKVSGFDQKVDVSYDLTYSKPEHECSMKATAAPHDMRWPNANITSRCTSHYLHFHACQEMCGKDHIDCYYFHRVFRDLCPNAWVEQWDKERAQGAYMYEHLYKKQE